MWAVLFCFDLFSLFASVFMVIRFCRPNPHKSLIATPVLNLFICDVIFSLRWLTVIAPSTFNWNDKQGNVWMAISPIICEIIGAEAHFSLLGIICWSYIIYSILFLLLLGYSNSTIKKLVQRQVLISWAFLFISTTVGLIFGVYGPLKKRPNDCSMHEKSLIFLSTIPSFATLVVSILVLCMAGFRYKSFRQQNKSKRLLQVSAFAFSYVLWWMFPAVTIIIHRTFRGTGSDIWEAFLDLLLCSRGTIDFLMWLRVGTKSHHVEKMNQNLLSNSLAKSFLIDSEGNSQLQEHRTSSQTNSLTNLFASVN